MFKLRGDFSEGWYENLQENNFSVNFHTNLQGNPHIIHTFFIVILC